MKNSDERRQSPRFYFTKEDGIHADFIHSADPDFCMSVHILSLSEDGLSFVVPRSEMEDAVEGDELTLVRISHDSRLCELQDIKLEIRHLIQGAENLICGAAFRRMKLEHAVALRDFILNNLSRYRS
ncbi:MAG: hypothetical protein JXQ27_13350 [Acidobacteria bacterium]|nr:hypothetical protein [Acidobacteriota bacterium]